MGTIFSKIKDGFLDLVTEGADSNLKFHLEKTGQKFNNFTRGDFILIGGRKTSGKSSYILNNYVTSPIHQKLKSVSNKAPFDVKILYINTRKTLKSTIERMIVNYTSYISKGTKLGVPALYGYSGSQYVLSKTKSKGLINQALNVFDRFTEKGYLSISTGRKSIYEIEQLVARNFEEMGEFDDEGVFTYYEKYEDTIPIVAIDGADGIYNDTSGSALRNDAANVLAIKLKELSKVYNAIIVLGVPSHSFYRNKGSVHVSSIDELIPYSIYCDRSIILHNPAETNEKNHLGYRVEDFINDSSGICYLRGGHVVSNYMGASGISFGYFIYPENGYMLELPPAEDNISLTAFTDLVNTRVVSKEKKTEIEEKRLSIEEQMENKDLDET